MARAVVPSGLGWWLRGGVGIHSCLLCFLAMVWATGCLLRSTLCFFLIFSAFNGSIQVIVCFPEIVFLEELCG